MRRLIAIVVYLLTAVSCVHQFPVPAPAPLVLSLVFDKGLAQGPVVDLTTRSSEASEFYDIRYVIHAFEKIGNNKYSDTPYAQFVFSEDDITNLDNTLTLFIMEGEYRIMIWADYVVQGSVEDLYYNPSDFKFVKLYGRDEGKDHVGNTDFRDAFIGSVDVDVVRFASHFPPVSATVDMSRPMSKVVFITNDLLEWKIKVLTSEKYNTAFGEQTSKPSNVNFDDYIMKIHYPQYMPNAFNVHSDRTTWSDANVSFSSRLIPMSESEASIGFDYVFANAKDANVVMAISLWDKKGNQLSRSHDITVPLDRGKVTTVRGSFLLEDSDGGVSINPDFEGEFNIVI